MRASPTRQVHNHARNIFGHTQSLHRVRPRNRFHATRLLQQSIAHLAREEARTNAIDGNMPWAQLHRQILPQMQYCRLARAIPIRAILTHCTNTNSRHARRDNHPARIRQRRSHSQQAHTLPNQIEHAPHIQVHDLGKRLVRMSIKGGAPGCASIGEQNVYMASMLLHLGDKVLHAGEGSTVRGDGDGNGIKGTVGEGIEDLAGGDAGVGFARGDEDLRGAGLEKAGLGGNGSVWLILFPSVQSIPTRKQGEEKRESLRGGGAKTETAGPAGHDGDFALEREQRGKIVQLGVRHGDFTC